MGRYLYSTNWPQGMAFPAGRPSVHWAFALVMGLRLFSGWGPPSSSGNGFAEVSFHVNIFSRILGLCSVLLPRPGTEKGQTIRMFIREWGLSLTLCKTANSTFLSGFSQRGLILINCKELYTCQVLDLLIEGTRKQRFEKKMLKIQN